ncbi:preprotein translocase subunit SecG [Candidatus Parcubacteria bacterium]|nr:MAG: preprotein translocase subunit SecG [Candidatus Parcubacteria bacterium]
MNTLLFLQIIVSTLLIVSIILQSRGSQVGIAFGGTGETYRSKRGLERFLYYVTIILSVIFASLSILLLLVR